MDSRLPGILKAWLTAVTGMLAVIASPPFISLGVAIASAIWWSLWLEQHPDT